MATATDLAGLGMAAQLAEKLGYQSSTTVGSGTTQAGAPTVISKSVTVQAATGATAVILGPNSDLGTEYWFFNPGTIGSAASALVFVPVGHTLSNGTNAVINQPYTLPVYASVILWQAQTKQWYVK
jgi:hypothetical protein